MSTTLRLVQRIKVSPEGGETVAFHLTVWLVVRHMTSTMLTSIAFFIPFFRRFPNGFWSLGGRLQAAAGNPIQFPEGRTAHGTN